MESELYIASAIQMAMLPKIFPPFADRPDLNIHGLVEPAKEVGGDLYDFYVRHDKLFFCIGDVSGKGVPASLVMAMTRSLFRTISAHEEKAATIVKVMNNAVTEQNTQKCSSPSSSAYSIAKPAYSIIATPGIMHPS